MKLLRYPSFDHNAKTCRMDWVLAYCPSSAHSVETLCSLDFIQKEGSITQQREPATRATKRWKTQHQQEPRERGASQKHARSKRRMNPCLVIHSRSGILGCRLHRRTAASAVLEQPLRPCELPHCHPAWPMQRSGQNGRQKETARWWSVLGSGRPWAPNCGRLLTSTLVRTFRAAAVETVCYLCRRRPANIVVFSRARASFTQSHTHTRTHTSNRAYLSLKGTGSHGPCWSTGSSPSDSSAKPAAVMTWWTNISTYATTLVHIRFSLVYNLKRAHQSLFPLRAELSKRTCALREGMDRGVRDTIIHGALLEVGCVFVAQRHQVLYCWGEQRWLEEQEPRPYLKQNKTRSPDWTIRIRHAHTVRTATKQHPKAYAAGALPLCSHT